MPCVFRHICDEGGGPEAAGARESAQHDQSAPYAKQVPLRFGDRVGGFDLQTGGVIVRLLIRGLEADEQHRHGITASAPVTDRLLHDLPVTIARFASSEG
jgi:hypothetical protein